MNRPAIYLIVFVSALAIGIGLFVPRSSTNNHELSPQSAVTYSSNATKDEVPGTTLVPGQTSVKDVQANSASQRDQHVDPSFGETVKFVVRETCDEDGLCVTGPVALHEYSNYTIEELKQIAEYDGAAAIILADKLGAVDFEEAKLWALRAFLLTKDPYAFQMVTNYSGVSVGETVNANGQLKTAEAEQAYIWLKMGHLLGVGDAADLGQQEMILDRHEVSGRERLDRIAEARVEQLNTKRLELTGRNF